jgi:ATP-dependent Lhr-like helicase
MSGTTSASGPVPARGSRGSKRAQRRLVDWFATRGWKPFPFQKEAWKAYLAGENGLIHATTGTGKTYAAWLGPVIEWLAQSERDWKRSKVAVPLQVLWVTPLRALAADTLNALQAPVADLGLPWTVETRTSDTASSVRNRQKQRLPTALITTPESLSVLLSQPDAAARFAHLQAVVVDEWHELLASKRGVKVELALARLRKWRPALRTWGLSATLGNLEEARVALLDVRSPRSTLIEGQARKVYRVDSLIPPSIERFPWAGHLGLRLAGDVATSLDDAATALVFTNTRSQTEAWYQGLLKTRPEWAGRIALHHGSLDRDTRGWVENGLRDGRLKCVVCTSSLDLGVDFSPVERVVQVGSPKGVARLMQRAGRSGHAPGQTSRVTCVPTNALELIEFAAARDAMAAGQLEGRAPPSGPLDVLVQHAVTIACGEGFHRDELLDEVRTSASYADVTDMEWDWVLDFVTTGGPALRAYPDYHKVERDADGRFLVLDRRMARQHRMSIGTIVQDAALTVQYLKGPKLGTLDEIFLAKLNPGDQFLIAGKRVELVRVQDSRVWVRKARSPDNARIPRWLGGRMPLSTQLADAVRRRLDAAAAGQFDGPEMAAIRPILDLQAAWSQIPRVGELLIERVRSREGFHIYVYPFAGRLVHEGLAALWAWRLSRRLPITFSLSVNDYGFELLSPTQPPLDDALRDGSLLAADDLLGELAQCLNAAEMGKRQFREVAHIAGLVFGGYPGQRKTARQLQASTGLLYDVFSNYDPHNLLLGQARREVFEQQLEQTRLVATLRRMRESEIVLREPPRFSPLSFPLLVDRLRERLSSEKLVDRVRRMQVVLENAAGAP